MKTALLQEAFGLIDDSLIIEAETKTLDANSNKKRELKYIGYQQLQPVFVSY